MNKKFRTYAGKKAFKTQLQNTSKKKGKSCSLILFLSKKKNGLWLNVKICSVVYNSLTPYFLSSQSNLSATLLKEEKKKTET